MPELKYERETISWYEHESNADATFRKKGPCSICENGTVYFSQLSKDSYNRQVGPACIRPHGAITYKTIISPSIGGFHRTDGPAVIRADGTKLYYIRNIQMSAEEFFLKYGCM